MCDTEEDVQFLFDSMLATCLPLLSIMYGTRGAAQHTSAPCGLRCRAAPPHAIALDFATAVPGLAGRYIALCKTTFQPFFCKPTIGGAYGRAGLAEPHLRRDRSHICAGTCRRYLLAIAPTIECWKSEHNALIAASCISIIV